jgi:hypothetical protein
MYNTSLTWATPNSYKGNESNENNTFIASNILINSNICHFNEWSRGKFELKF